MDDKETVRRGYDELAAEYAARRSASDREVAVLEEFLDSLSDPTRVLDVGCGQGFPTLRRASRETTAVGLDLSREQLRVAAETVSVAPLVHADMTALPFRDDVFDAVIAYNSVIHIPLADHQTVFEEFARVLSPGGRVVLSEAPEAFERATDDWLDGGVEMRWSMAGSDATRDHLRSAGFRVTDVWQAPDQDAEDGPFPPFFVARLEP
jgi:ubiquinone/menaquinone biosynthesis C-methylase UbiE